jgi:hypothetical protein
MNWQHADPPIIRAARSHPDQYPDDALGAARGAVYGLGLTGCFCALLPVLGWLLAGIRLP